MRTSEVKRMRTEVRPRMRTDEMRSRVRTDEAAYEKRMIHEALRALLPL